MSCLSEDEKQMNQEIKSKVLQWKYKQLWEDQRRPKPRDQEEDNRNKGWNPS